MTREEAIRTLQFGEWWDFLSGEIGDYAESTLHEALNLAIDALREQEERLWIPVSERLPDNGQKVVFFNYGADAVYAGKFNYIGARGTVWFRAGKTSYPGSYWMPLPEPPKEDAS